MREDVKFVFLQQLLSAYHVLLVFIPTQMVFQYDTVAVIYVFLLNLNRSAHHVLLVLFLHKWYFNTILLPL